MTKYKTSKPCNATVPDKIINKLDLVEFAIPPSAKGHTDEIDSLLWTLAVAMARAPEPGSTRRSASEIPSFPNVLKVVSLRRHSSGAANASSLDMAECIINAWNSENPSEKLQPFVLTSLGWNRFDCVSRKAKEILLRFDQGTWAAYAPRSLVCPGQPQARPRPQPTPSPEVLRGAAVAQPKTQSNVSAPQLEQDSDTIVSQSDWDDRFPRPPSDIRYIYPDDATDEDRRRPPIVNLRKGLWGVCVEIVKPISGTKEGQRSSANDN